MPMSLKSAESRMQIYVAMASAHEAFLSGKLTDPGLTDKDFDQVDPDDLEEMDLKWQMAMITVKAK